MKSNNRSFIFSLSTALKHLSLNHSTKDGHIELKGIRTFRRGILILEELGIFKNVVGKILKLLLTNVSTKDILYLQKDEGQAFLQSIDNLKYLIEEMINAINAFSPNISGNYVSIKLPELKDFDQLGGFSISIQKILGQTILTKPINGKIEIESVENGSIWINVLVGTGAAVAVLGSLAWAAAVIRNKILEGNALAEQVKSLNLKNDSLDDIKESQKKTLELMLEAEAKYLFSEHYNKDKTDHEQIQRLKHTISTLAELMTKGAEVHPSIFAKEEVKNLFPDFINLNSIESKIKKLASGRDD